MSAQGAGAPTLSRSRAATKQAGSRRLAQKRENAVSAAPITDEAEGHSPPSAAQETSRRSSVMRQWTPSEDELLRTAVANNKASSWATIAEAVPGRNHVQCFHRWTEALKPGLVKGAWSEAEDQLLIHLKASSGQKTSWGQLSQLVPGRSTKQCRERWQNFLDPALNKSKWTEVSFFRTAGFSHISWWRPQHRMLAHLIARTHPPSCQTPPRSCRRTRTLPFYCRTQRSAIGGPLLQSVAPVELSCKFATAGAHYRSPRTRLYGSVSRP